MAQRDKWTNEWMNERTNEWTNKQKIFPFYRTFSPIGAAAEKPNFLGKPLLTFIIYGVGFISQPFLDIINALIQEKGIVVV